MLLRCSLEEASRIRTAAERRQTSISGFVRRAVKRSWEVTEGIMVSHQMSEVLAVRFAEQASSGLYPPPTQGTFPRRPE
jgi:hypothetical protein